MKRALAMVLAACATGPAPRVISEDVQVETVTLALQPEGKGTVGFLLDIAARPRAACTISRVEWRLLLHEHDFAAGLASSGVGVPAGERSRVSVREPVAFGGMGYDGRPRTVPVTLEGTVFAACGRGEEKKGFAYRTRVAVRG